jgi:acetyl esterase/lipase
MADVAHVVIRRARERYWSSMAITDAELARARRNAQRRGLPPLLAQVGEDELLLDDGRRLVERAHAAGVDATLEVWPGLWHIFATQGTFLESRQAMQRLGYFLCHRLAAIPAAHTRRKRRLPAKPRRASEQ